MYRSEHPAFALPRSVALRRQSSGLGDLRREWVGRDVNMVPAGQGVEAWLLVTDEGETAWLPVGLRTLGELHRAVGGDVGRVRGGTAVSFARPLPLAVLADLEPATYRLLEQAAEGLEMGEDAHLGGMFSSIGKAIKKVTKKAKKVVKKVGKTVAKTAKSVAKAVKKSGKYVVGGALIVGGVALGVATGGAALPVAAGLVGAGVGIITKKGSGLGKFKEWAPRALIGGAAGAALGFGAQFVMEGGLTQVGSSLFSSSSGTQLATVGAGSATTTGEAVTAAGGSSLWSSIPVGAIVKTAAGFAMKSSAGAAAPVSFLPGMAPTSPGMTIAPLPTPAYDPATAAPESAAAPGPGLDTNVLLIAGVAAAAILVLGLRR